MLRRSGLALTAVVLTALAVVIGAGHPPWPQGPVLWSFNRRHGIDLGDVPTMVLWVLGMIGLGLAWPRTRRPS